ncbi:hypothetical protein ZYGR_0A01380 [Zygosaccharomyces rouxii]|uniref:ZYRO0A03124p n=2 Tax=Zygosaccharomyces rouxii TaxID=4956 RepID=C5DPG2_ZYGRC|nr:uncharacterized protein ZYRO0A03124g [Zygosaccharomyces rouxii]KAH9198906.1 flavoprotein-like protein [Zygosaccharomyces rouxii]GAV46546.1 hypothetical protein ZYGR_0A01380 [Zygosaccharomyces rouxii]CAR25573.1 ZYRO0A03124p [Zygosaccharomyces rouxii]
MAIAIILYSLHEHIAALAEIEKEGVELNGIQCDIFQVPETFDADTVKELGGKPTNYPIANREVLEKYDAFLLGIPTRFGNMPAQWSAFWDATNTLWIKGSLHGKLAGVFVCTGSGGGNENTIASAVTTLVHHGMIYVPLGYYNVMKKLSRMDKVKGGGPWGAGTISGPEGEREPSLIEKKIAREQGRKFGKIYWKTTH